MSEQNKNNGFVMKFLRLWPIFSFLIVFAAGYGVLQAQTSNNKDNIKELKNCNKEAANERRSMQTDIAVIKERIGTVQEDVSKIKSEQRQQSQLLVDMKNEQKELYINILKELQTR